MAEFNVKPMRVSLTAWEKLTEVKRAMQAESDRQVTYSEVITRLAALYQAPAGQS